MSISKYGESVNESETNFSFKKERKLNFGFQNNSIKT